MVYVSGLPLTKAPVAVLMNGQAVTHVDVSLMHLTVLALSEGTLVVSQANDSLGHLPLSMLVRYVNELVRIVGA